MAGQMTTADFMNLPAGTLAELIDGEIIQMSPSPQARHQEITGNAYSLLKEFVKARNLGKVLIAPLDVHLPSGDVVEPDVLFVPTRSLHIIKDWVRGVPELLVEVLSPHNVPHDRKTKRRIYAKNRVQEYWIVDAAAKTVEVLTLAGDRYDVHAVCRPGESIRSPLFPDLALPVGDVLA